MNPPSFLRHTPGLLGRGAIHEFHLRIHLCSLMCSSIGQGTEASGRDCTAAKKRVEVLATPHPGARSAATPSRGDAAFACGFAQRAGRLEAAVFRGLARGQKGLYPVGDHRRP
ncbi:MAG TPA: hypothetical protein VGM06_13180 [Polyangiaceae bacterium]|jgi:hypothetical protein